MKYRWIYTAWLAVLLLFPLGGCQLALKDGQTIQNKDRLIGIFVTSQSLHVTDWQDDSGVNQSRLYAQLTTKELIGEAGEKVEMQEYEFTDVEGIPYFAANMPETVDQEGFISSSSDEAISDGHMSLHLGDDGDRTELKGTIYLSPQSAYQTQFVNPVYQSNDGRVYVMTGTGGGHVIRGDDGERAALTQSLTETTAATENGNTKTKEIAIHISFSTIWSPRHIVVLQMDDNSNVVDRAEYIAGDMPASITLQQGVQYIVVETHKNDNDGKEFVSRALFAREDETLDTFFCREDSICVKKWTALIWEME